VAVGGAVNREMKGIAGKPHLPSNGEVAGFVHRKEGADRRDRQEQKHRGDDDGKMGGRGGADHRGGGRAGIGRYVHGAKLAGQAHRDHVSNAFQALYQRVLTHRRHSRPPCGMPCRAKCNCRRRPFACCSACSSLLVRSTGTGPDRRGQGAFAPVAVAATLRCGKWVGRYPTGPGTQKRAKPRETRQFSCHKPRHSKSLTKG